MKNDMSDSQTKDLLCQVTLVMGGLGGGGTERVATHLINVWVEKGYLVKLISMRGPEKDVYSIPDEVQRIVLGGEGETSNKLIAFIKNIFYVLKLRKAIKIAETPTILSFITRANIYSIIACFGLTKHVVISERNDTSRQVLRWPWYLLRKKLYKYSDVVTANSTVSINDMSSYVPNSKLAFVPNPVRLPNKKRMASPDKSTNILNVARLTSHKRQNLLIEALFKLGMSYQDWNLQILGKGGQQKNLIEYAEAMKISERVELPGFVNNPSDYYRSAAIFVLPSLYEGTSNALLEAMGYGLPCIVSDSLPGAMELIENEVTGLSFKNGDSEDLVQKMMLLIKNPKLRIRLGKAAHNRVREFTPEKVAKIWEKILQPEL